ncbi:MAG TPA: protein kinase [Pseudomonadota bacterium]|nr:protein kinase [Pseudomonadota bacterium]
MSTTPMVRGTLIAARFEIDRSAGHGGMGTVYRAHDTHTGRLVALKILHRLVGAEANANYGRLIIEAQLLADLRHESIVSYIAHGFTPSGLPFLAMEWLEGEDLSERLQREPLSLHETVLLVRAVADALAVAHARGIIHRDIKPSNLFLREGRPERATLLDFGVARQRESLDGLTRTGTLLGTPEYMAPEQARGERALTASADIFSLGCVLFRCLTGAPPFSGAHLSMLLAKLLSDEVPDIRRLRPDLPPALAELSMRMLSKSPAARPADGTALLHELAPLHALALSQERGSVPPQAGTLHLFRQDERLVSVVMSSPQAPAKTPTSTAEIGDAAAAAAADLRLQRIALRQALAELHCQADFLIDGSIVAFISEAGTAEDLAVKAVRCAQLIKQLGGGSLVAVATGNGRVHHQRPIGDAIDRLAEFFHTLDLDGDAARFGEPRTILVDETTAGLVATYFSCVRLRSGLFLLEGLSRQHDAPRLLLGRPTPYVGRQHELALLAASMAESAEESIARVTLFIGEAGLGKTRLRSEFLERQSVLSEYESVTLLSATATSLEANQPYSLLCHLLLSLIGVCPDEPPQTTEARLKERLTRHVAAPYRREIGDVLGQACRLRPAGHSDAFALGGRESPANDPVHLAFLRFLSAECARRYVLLVLDNLQWADPASLRLLDLALRALASAPLFVLGLGRPELSRRFPRLWNEHRVQEIRLKPLNRSECGELVQHLVPDRASDDLKRRIYELSLGNPRFLEELVMSISEGEIGELPATLLAMMQGRLMTLPTDARSLLRAASLFSDDFTLAELYELVRGDVTQAEVERLLQLLCELDLLVPDRRSPDPAKGRYRFRDVIVRQAAYSLLDREDRRQGQGLIAALRSSASRAPSGERSGAA